MTIASPKRMATVCQAVLPALVLTPWSLAFSQEHRDSAEPLWQIEEVSITAEKESESLQATAAAVTVIASDTVITRGFTELSTIQNLLPSVRLQKESVSTEIYIRGVGSTTDLPMIEPPNAYNINGIYIPREVSTATLLDVERIEVLPGPQGTLYGRGAMGGVVNTVTTRPGEELESRVVVEGGNYAHLRAAVTHNLPINDELRLRGTVSSLSRDGYLKSGADSAEDLAGFLAIDFTPSDALNVMLWGLVETKGGKSANLLSKGQNEDPRSQRFPTGDPWNDELTGSLAGFATLGDIDAQDKDWDTILIAAEVNWRVNDKLSLTYLPSYLDFEWRQGYWLTHKDGDFNEQIDQQTHELRFNFDSGGALSGLAGLYAYRIETAGQLYIQFGPNELFPGAPGGLWLDASDVRAHQLQGAALFGQLNYSISDTFRVVAGARASYDERDGHGFQPDIVVGPAVGADPVGLFTGVAPPGWDNQDDWSNVDWKLGVEHDLAIDTMAYLTAQTGFQPGTFDVFPSTTTEESELLAITAGIKNRLFDGQLTLNNEFFYYIYNNLLVQAFDAATGTNRLTNADTIIFGDQLDLVLTLNALPNTRVSVSAGYLHARYEDFLKDELDVFNKTQMQNAPDWTATAGIVHDWGLASGAYIRADISSRFESGYWGDFSHSAGLYQQQYTKTDVALTYHAANENWSIGLWVKNLEDQDAQSAAAPGNPLADPGPGAPFLEPPRTFGLRYLLQM